MNNLPLKVLDFSHRLPGPLCTHALERLGAKVTKVEDTTFGDPFKDGFFKEMDPSFSLWYEALNHNKEIITLDFKSAEAKKTISRLIEESDIIINGLPTKIEEKFGLDEASLNKNKQKKVVIKMVGSKKKQGGMHDLNVLAKLGLLDLYIQDKGDKVKLAPPFLPIGGICFGPYLASTALASYIKLKDSSQSIVEVVALEDAVETLLAPFFSKELKETGQRKFLHNGRYPCYNLYSLKEDGYLAVAALEDKYWQRFCNALQLGEIDRFHHQDNQVFDIIINKISSLSANEAHQIFDSLDCCVDIVTH